MPRIPSNSIIIQVDFSQLDTIVKTIEYLIENKVEKTCILLEPVAVETRLNRELVTLAVNPPALIIPSLANTHELSSGVRVDRDTWAEYTCIDPQLLHSVMKPLIDGRDIVVENLEVHIEQSCIECTTPLVLQQYILKYPHIPHIIRVDYELVENQYRELLRKGVVVVVACVKLNTIQPLVWLEEKNNAKTLYACKPSRGLEWIVYGSIIDIVLYAISTRSARSTN